MILKRIGSDTRIRFNGETHEFKQGEVYDFDSVNEKGTRIYNQDTAKFIIKNSRPSEWEEPKMVFTAPVEAPKVPETVETTPTLSEAPVVPEKADNETVSPVDEAVAKKEAEARKQAIIEKAKATRARNKALKEEAMLKAKAEAQAEVDENL